jgi:hypothetical protein
MHNGSARNKAGTLVLNTLDRKRYEKGCFLHYVQSPPPHPANALSCITSSLEDGVMTQMQVLSCRPLPPPPDPGCMVVSDDKREERQLVHCPHLERWPKRGGGKEGGNEFVSRPPLRKGDFLCFPQMELAIHNCL